MSTSTMNHQYYNYNLSISMIENVTYHYNNMMLSSSNDFLLIFLDKSQLVMTIIGVIANMGTSFVLFTNGQVSRTLYISIG